MFEYVKDLGLKPSRAYSKRKRTDRILLHHFGSNGSVQSVHDYHIGRGHAGIDYNVVVLANGDVVWGRGLDYCGGSVNNTNAKTKGFNDTSVAIAVQGDIEHNVMPQVQKDALFRVVKDIAQHYGFTRPDQIVGHDEAAGPGYTDCPGKLYPLQEIKEYALGQSVVVPPVIEQPEVSIPKLTRNLKLKSPMMSGEDVRMAQKRLDHHLVDVGGIDGVYGDRTRKGVIAFQKARIAEGYDLGSAGADGVVGWRTWELLWQG
ncbi:MAG: N-acetylmuramoyl-L-alanine amidase [Christensenella sp.]|uniref:peptidoglycan recognition protein family protein n=1 Tax=Christensenella sp. TaxID=1935934 RepID=UPI002B1F16B0|nr:N-acetylmuramoyl-L-alanine amidase [Christensenella sp.]MEA5004322.1 N-acetylmuramoyl-L-alanine amidase [Christensenella sp.]